MMRRTVQVDGVQHIVIAHDPARAEYFVSASDNATTGAFYLCRIDAGRRACTCKAGQHGFRQSHRRAHCRHVEAALHASVLEAAELLLGGELPAPEGAQGLANPFAP